MNLTSCLLIGAFMLGASIAQVDAYCLRIFSEINFQGQALQYKTSKINVCERVDFRATYSYVSNGDNTGQLLMYDNYDCQGNAIIAQGLGHKEANPSDTGLDLKSFMFVGARDSVHNSLHVSCDPSALP